MNIDSVLIDRIRTEYLLPARRQLDAAWSWWTSELADMLPSTVRRLLGNAPERTYLLLGTDEVIAFRGTNGNFDDTTCLPIDGSEGESGETPLELEDAILVLPTDKTLIKRITLPAATEQNLHGVLEFEMDRETPFAPEQVYFDGVVISRSGREPAIDVELVLTPRQYLDELLERLSDRGIRPASVTARNRQGKLIEANLLPSSRMPVRPRAMNRLNIGLAAAACLLLAIAVTLPIQQKLAVIAELNPLVEAAREAAREGSRIRDNIERLHAGAENLIARKASEPMMLELLDATTRTIPDDTYIGQFQADASGLRLTGESASAAPLIELLDRSPEFRNPQFSAPVTRTRRSNRERFDLSVQWASRGDQ